MKPELYDKMMDDKATEEKARVWFLKNCGIQRRKPAKCCLGCPFVDYKTGKPKLPQDKPPLLSNGEIKRLYSKRAMFPIDWCEAQRESDIKHYEAEI